MAAIQLGNASLALAAAAKLNGNLPEAEAALRHAVSELRWVLGVSAADMERLGSSKVEVSVHGRWALLCGTRQLRPELATCNRSTLVGSWYVCVMVAVMVAGMHQH